MTTLEDYCKKIPEGELDKPIDHKNVRGHSGQVVLKDLGTIAEGLADWKTYATHLDLTPSDIANIEKKEQSLTLQAREALQLWRSRRGAAMCTPRHLIEIFHKAKALTFVDHICHVLGKDSDCSVAVLEPAANGATTTDCGSDLIFSKSMSPEQVGKWLYQEFKRDKKFDDEKIKLVCTQFTENDVDGEAFLEVTEELFSKESPFKEMKITWGLKQKILKLVKREIERSSSVKEPIEAGNTSDEQDHSQPAKKVKLSLHEYWCTFSMPDPVQATPTAAAIPEGSYSACMPLNTNLWSEKVLLIQFEVKNRHLLRKWNITEDQILLWASKWKCSQGPNYIPSFRLANPKETSAHVIIELNERGTNRSLLGNTGRGKTNMWLDLSHNDDKYREHLVVHEFGHILGLAHEHQRSDFWKRIQHLIDKKKMKKDLGNRFKDWEEDPDLIDGAHDATEYDCHSVMHYWFKISWLRNEYQDLKKIDDEHKRDYLTLKQKEALKGIHLRGNLAITPSEMDLDFLNNKYAQGAPAVSHGCTPSNGATDYDQLDKVNNTYLDLIKWKCKPDIAEPLKEVKVYEGLSPDWRDVATKLSIPKAVINNIETNIGDNMERVIKVFDKWLDNASGLPNAKLYPLSWSGLIKLIDNCDHRELAKGLKAALQAPYSSVKKNI